MTRISVRGFAVASATAVTAVGAVVGVASGSEQGEATATGEPVGSTLLTDIPSGQQAQQAVSVNFSQQGQAQADVADQETRKAAEQDARKAAANKAAEKKAAADEAARKKAEQEQREKEQEQQESVSSQSASLGAITPQSSYTVAEIQAMARQIVGDGQFTCFSNIVQHESGWNYKAVNPSSGAYGLVQAYPGSKMASVGADWQTNPATQIQWGLNYMNERYGSPCGAWDYWQTHNSY